MKNLICSSLLSLLAGFSVVTVQAATLDIEWKNPEEYKDIRTADLNQERFRKRVIEDLTEQFTRTAMRVLPEDQHLVIRVNDVDLAGNIEYFFYPDPSRNAMRVIGDIYFPRLVFDYQLLDAERELITSGHAEAEDRQFYFFSEYMRDDPFYFEKRLIDLWFSRTFAKQLKAEPS